MLGEKDQRHFKILIGAILLSAALSAVMVASIMPFLSVVANPSVIQGNALLEQAFKIGGFSDPYYFLIFLGGGSIAIIILASAAQLYRVWLINRFLYKKLHDFSTEILSSHLNQEYISIVSSHSGDVSTIILSETNEAIEKFYRPMAEIGSAALTIIMILGMLFFVNFTATLIVTGILGGLLVFLLAVSRKLMREVGAARARANKRRFRVVQEALQGAKVIKFLGLELEIADRYSRESRTVASAAALANLVGQAPGYLIQAIAFGGVIAIVLVLLDPAKISTGAAASELIPLLGLFAFAGQRLLPELNRIYFSMSSLRYGSEAVSNIYAGLNLGKDRTRSQSRTNSTPSIGLKDQLEINGLTYTYPNADRPSLIIEELSIRAGEKIGIIGPTGSGKTTLADILLGLLAPTSGQIISDGSLIQSEDIAGWRSTIGYVPQESFLVDATVAENIAFGVKSEEIDMSRVRRAAKIASIDLFIEKNLADGYEELLGDRGQRLSGGQRQRLGIARALYNDADLIVFDEATSALDNITESEVMSAIYDLPGDKTVLIIAHRLSTVRNCDRIVVLEGGKIECIGDWKALERNSEVFNQLIKSHK